MMIWHKALSADGMRYVFVVAVMAFTPLAASARCAGPCRWQAEFAGHADHALDLHSATSLLLAHR